MKTAYRIAQELGVTPKTVYTKITPKFLLRLEGHIALKNEGKKNKQVLFDEIGEQILKDACKKVEKPVTLPTLHQQVTLAVKKRGLIQRAYYITIEQYRLLKITAAQDETDTSTLVREAIQQFLDERGFDESSSI
jgi:hypothetical protein